MSKIKQAIEAMSVRTWFMVDDCIYPTKPKESKYGRSTEVIPLEDFQKLAAAMELCREQRNEFLMSTQRDELIAEKDAAIMAILKGSEG